MSVLIQIRDVDESVRDALKARTCVIDASVLVDLLTGVMKPEALSEAATGQWHAPAHLAVEALHALSGIDVPLVTRDGRLARGTASVSDVDVLVV